MHAQSTGVMYRGIMGFGHFGSFCSDEVACGDLSAATEDYEGKSKWLHRFVTFDEVHISKV